MKTLLLILWMTLSAHAAAPSPILGVWGKHPWDSDVTHVLLDTVPYTWTFVNLDYDYWTNGTPFPPTNGPAFYDEFYALNTNANILLGIYGVPTNAIASFVPMILARYPLVWGVIPLNEEQNMSVANNTTLLFRAAVTNKPLVGPGWLNDYDPGVIAAMAPAMTNYDALNFHDYFQAPGQGLVSYPPWYETNYTHPDDAYSVNIPALPARIAWMQSLTNQLRTNYPAIPKIFLGEFAFYVSNVLDTVKAAQMLKAGGVISILNAPNGPAGETNSLSYNQAYYNSNASAAYWSEAMLEFVKQMNPTKTYTTLRIGR